MSRSLRTTLRATVPAVLAGLLTVPCLGSSASAAPPGFGIVCSTGPDFNLRTTTGFIVTPDGNSVFMWGFAERGEDFQIPGPVLCVDEGDAVTIRLTNNRLPEPTSIVFPGQTGVTTSGGTPGLLTAEAPRGETVTYSFTASEPGTYLYESGTEPQKQVHMGLYGVLIVRPAMGDNFAYNHQSAEFDPDREYLIVLHEIDPDLHRAVENGLTYDATVQHDRYWTVNGRSFPDTIAENFVPWLPAQPHSALVTVEPFDEESNPLPALVRYANAGMTNHPFHPHGNNQRIIARDGRLLRGVGDDADLSYESFTTTVGAGQTYDLLAQWFDLDAWSSGGNPLPLLLPGLQDLVFKDDQTFYSGSPYLGEQDELPPAVTAFTECGELYFPWHSHALNEFNNFDEGFGGLATLWRVEPAGGC